MSVDSVLIGDALASAGRLLFGDSWQGPMADLLGVRGDTVRGWHSGRRSPPPDIFWKLSTAVVKRSDAARKQLHEARLAVRKARQ